MGDMKTPDRYPLAWPEHRPRTKGRRPGRFTAENRPIGVAAALRRVDQQLGMIGARWPILSSNLEVRVDGSPVLNRGMPTDPGVCLYFDLKGKPFALACDTFSDIAQNVAAVAAHLEATRAIERYGVATAAESLQAFSALPPPAAAKPVRPWWEVFGVDRAAIDADDVRALFKVKAKKAHPDTGGTADAMSELNTALAQALSELAR